MVKLVVMSTCETVGMKVMETDIGLYEVNWEVYFRRNMITYRSELFVIFKEELMVGCRANEVRV